MKTNEQTVPLAWTNLLAYVLQDEMQNRLTPRVVDIAYTAFMRAKQPNAEDGGASDWFNDTKPVVMRAIDKLREDLSAEGHLPAASEARTPRGTPSWPDGGAEAVAMAKEDGLLEDVAAASEAEPEVWATGDDDLDLALNMGGVPGDGALAQFEAVERLKQRLTASEAGAVLGKDDLRRAALAYADTRVMAVQGRASRKDVGDAYAAFIVALDAAQPTPVEAGVGMRHVCNLWVDPETRKYVVDHCDHPLNECIPAYIAAPSDAPAHQEWCSKCGCGSDQHGYAHLPHCSAAPAARGDERALALRDLDKLVEYSNVSDDHGYATIAADLVREMTAKACAVLSRQPSAGDAEASIDYSIKKGDEVFHPRWTLTSLRVVDVNWAIKAVAVRLGDGDVVIWPAAGLQKIDAARAQRAAEGDSHE